MTQGEQPYGKSIVPRTETAINTNGFMCPVPVNLEGIHLYVPHSQKLTFSKLLSKLTKKSLEMGLQSVKRRVTLGKALLCRKIEEMTH